VPKILLVAAVATLLVIPSAFAADHHMLNGSWILLPSHGSDAAGAIQAGQITIKDREHNIYISRNFTYEGASETVTSNFTTDGREQATIRQGKTFRIKAKWDGDVLKVTTISDQVNEKEQYSLRPDGTMMLVVDRAGDSPRTLYFRREE
jgi:hypothetical protein